MKKIIYFLMSTESYIDRQERILNTWGINKELYFFSEVENLERRVLKVCDENDVETKQVSVFDKIESDFYNKYEWYFFGDDDTFVNTYLLEKELESFDKTKVIGQDIFGCWDDLHYPSGGGGFLIHNNVIHNFFKSKNYGVGWGDVTFGLNMRDKNIEIQNDSRFNSQKFDFYGIDIHKVYEHITFHYVKDYSEMLKMEEICKNNIL